MKVSTDALYKRINRKLTADGEVLKRTRGQRYFADLGEYYILDISTNTLVDSHLDLEELGKRLGVLGTVDQLEARSPISRRVDT